MDQTGTSQRIHIPPFLPLSSTSISSIPQDSPASPGPLATFPKRSKRKYPCHICTMDFPYFNNLSRHTRIVHNENPRNGVKCSLCSQCFENFKGLTVHMVAKHRNIMTTDQREDEEGRGKKRRRLYQREDAAKKETKDEDVEDPLYCIESNPTALQTSKLETLPQSSIGVKTEESQIICSICHQKLERSEAMKHLKEHNSLADEQLEGFVERVTKVVTANVLMTLQVMGYVRRR